MKKIVMLTSLIGIMLSCNPKTQEQKSEEKNADFKFLVDEFADIKIMRYQIPNWDQLSLQQKEYIYYLNEAAKSGRDILWDQNFKYNLAVRKTLENILTSYKGDTSASEYPLFVNYAKRVFFSNGIHHHYSTEKMFPEFSEAYFSRLIENSNLSEFPKKEEQSIEAFTKWMSEIVFNKELYQIKKSSDNTKDLLAESSTNFYEGVTEKEANQFYNSMEKPNDKTPVSYGLNSKLVKKGGKITEDVYKLDGLYGEAIDQIIYWLKKSMAVAENETQKQYTQLLIDYYKTGNLKTWDDYNIAWVQDTESSIDYVNGFIENYGDPLGRKATWEAVVNFKDIDATKITSIISRNAQWFEDNSPIDPIFKKKEVKGVSAKGIIVTNLAGDCFPSPPIGINLPNADWIRKDFGSKSVTITNLMEAYDRAADESPKNTVSEFSFSKEEIELNKKYGARGNVLHTDLHECLGHGSGQLLPGTSSNALLENSASLEEARADLFALYYCADPKMVELGIIPSLDVSKAEYNSYIRNGLLVQLARIDLGKNISQAHMQARKLISEWCFEKGREENIIEKKVKDGKTYFVINNHEKLRQLFGKLLAEIQRIKSEGNYTAGKNLIDTYAVKINPELHKEIKERYLNLQIKPYGGFINPEITPVEKEGKVVDYKVEYPTDFMGQHLLYGKKYNFLKAVQ